MKIKFVCCVFSIISFLFFSCEDDKLSSDDCQEDLICTEEFRTITLEITDQNGAAVILDNYYTFIDSRNRFDIEDGNVLDGIYPVVSDAEREELSTEGTTLIFVGEIAGKNVVEHQMVVKDNCCHVELLDGSIKIQIEN